MRAAPVLRLSDASQGGAAPYRAAESLASKRGAHGAGEPPSALLLAIVDGSSDAVFVRDAEGRHLLCNPAAARILGLAPSDVIGRQDWEVFPADVAYQLRELDQTVISSGAPASLEIRIPRSDGGAAYLDVRIVPRTDVAASGVIMFARDMTGPKRVDEALRQREQQLVDAQTVARLGSWEWDLERAEVTWSAAMRQVCGIEGPDRPLTPDECLTHVHPADRDRTRDILEHAALTGISVELEHRIIRADGTEAVILCRAAVTRDERNRPVRMFGTTQDITAQREAERSLRAATAEAERASEAKSEFLSRMSHELRTPLNAILGFGQVMASDPNLTDRESVEEILSAGEHLLGMINDILDLSRIEAGRIPLSIEPVPLGRTLRESCDMVRRSAAQAGVSLRISPVCDSDRHLMADARRVKQVLLNLLTNGIKYNRRGGAVEVTCSVRDGETLRVDVRDTGIGMNDAQIGRLFSPFERGGAERTGIEGTGLGLALSKRLIEAMGGELGVTSAPGSGSTFWFALPLAPAPDPAGLPAPPEPLPEPAQSPSHRKVLYVEDSPANLRLIQRLFARRPDWELVTATSGEDGLACARSDRPDLILLDVQLPDLNGDEILWRLQQDPDLRDVPVVAVSGDATSRQIQRLLDLGAREYLTKPINLTELLLVVDELLPKEDQILHPRSRQDP